MFIYAAQSLMLLSTVYAYGIGAEIEPRASTSDSLGPFGVCILIIITATCYVYGEKLHSDFRTCVHPRGAARNSSSPVPAPLYYYDILASRFALLASAPSGMQNKTVKKTRRQNRYCLGRSLHMFRRAAGFAVSCGS